MKRAGGGGDRKYNRALKAKGKAMAPRALDLIHAHTGEIESESFLNSTFIRFIHKVVQNGYLYFFFILPSYSLTLPRLQCQCCSFEESIKVLNLLQDASRIAVVADFVCNLL